MGNSDPLLVIFSFTKKEKKIDFVNQMKRPTNFILGFFTGVIASYSGLSSIGAGIIIGFVLTSYCKEHNIELPKVGRDVLNCVLDRVKGD